MKTTTSWQQVSHWYNKKVSLYGHYYHQQVILPHLLNLLPQTTHYRLLDLACGQGVLARNLPEQVNYVGVDLAKDLIKYAQQHSQSERQQFYIANVCQDKFFNQLIKLEQSRLDEFSIRKRFGKKIDLSIQNGNYFDYATCILALQNLDQPEQMLNNVAFYLKPQGKLILVINHPCFRVPRQSAWQIDEKNKLQYRRVNCYLTPLRVPIKMQPFKTNPKIKNSQETVTYSFHYSLDQISLFLSQAGFIIERIEEWTSDKKSLGKTAKMENKARKEFPLFMMIQARKDEL